MIGSPFSESFVHDPKLPIPKLHANLTVSVKHVGLEHTPIMVIDHCLADPQSLVKFAQQPHLGHSAPGLVHNKKFETHNAGFYPGLRSALPDYFGEYFLQQLTPLLCEGLSSGGSIAHESDTHFEHGVSCLSIAGIKKENLRPIQSLPHFDDTRADQFALVLYLFNGELGGTGFYRHRSSGYERISRERLPKYAPCLKAEAMAHKELLFRYMGRANALFEQTEYVAPAFNRAVIYPSNCLHSGVLSNEREYSLCAVKGRLTANMLFISNEV